MEKASLRLAFGLLAFGIGVAFAGIFYFDSGRTIAHPLTPLDPAVVEPSLPSENKGKTLEMVFVLDTTGSMGGLIDGAKQKIWSIVNDVMQKESRPSVRVGLVAYRDRGDDYETQVLPVTADLDKVYAKLMELQAAGGGDHPENVQKALADGVKNAGWSKQRAGLAQILFLVGDAPPQNYQNEPGVLATTDLAIKQNMIVNTIQCGSHGDTTKVWNQIALRGQGKYFAIAQDGGVNVINTPYDADIAQLGQKIASGYMAYGAPPARLMAMDGVAATESKVAAAASNTARADRALNKALNSEAYAGDLVQEIENGRVKLESIKDAELPSDLQKLTPAQRKVEIDKRLAERKEVRAKIVELSKKRAAFIADEQKKTGRANGFDSAVGAALTEQLAKKGIK